MSISMFASWCCSVTAEGDCCCVAIAVAESSETKDESPALVGDVDCAFDRVGGGGVDDDDGTDGMDWT